MAASDAASQRTEKALARVGLADVRPLYRQLLVRLKGRDASAYDEAVRRYETEVLPALEDSEGDLVAVWIEYGRWLAQKISPGAVQQIDASGRARACPADEDPVLPSLLLHIPDAATERALALALPSEPSEPQQVTLELLAGR